MSLSYIVSGTGRCGTVFMAKYLSHLDIPCGHESIFDYSELSVALKRLSSSKERTISHCSTNKIEDGIWKKAVNWVDPKKIIAESSYMATPYLAYLPNVPLIHVYRNGLKVISSFIGDLDYFKYPNWESNNTIGNSIYWQKHIYNALPELSEIKTQIERACYFYIKWNELLKKEKNNRPYLLLNIECVENNVKLLDFLKKEPKEFICDNFNSFKRRKRDLTSADIPDGAIKKDFIRKLNVKI